MLMMKMMIQFHLCLVLLAPDYREDTKRLTVTPRSTQRTPKTTIQRMTKIIIKVTTTVVGVASGVEGRIPRQEVVVALAIHFSS